MDKDDASGLELIKDTSGFSVSSCKEWRHIKYGSLNAMDLDKMAIL